ARVAILAPAVRDRKGEYRKELEAFRRQGFVRARIDGELRDLGEEIALARTRRHTIEVVVDRLAVKPAVRARITESLETALRLASGLAVVAPDGGPEQLFSERNACARCGTSFPEISPRTFSFNSPHGACPGCDGLGTRDAFDAARLVPDPSLPLGDGAIAPWGKLGGRSGPRHHQGPPAPPAAPPGAPPPTPPRGAPPPRRRPPPPGGRAGRARRARARPP